MHGNFVLKPEEQLILNCSLIHPTDDNIKQIKHLISLSLDWDYLIHLSYLHRLNNLLYWNLIDICPNSIPNNIKIKLKEHFFENAQRNLYMFKELLDLIDLLKKHGITPIPYKGPLLSLINYKNLGFREFNDLDFYIPLHELPRTKGIMIKEGYELGLEMNFNQERVFYKYQREYNFLNKSKNISIEIKWRFLSNYNLIRNEPFNSYNDFLKVVNVDEYKIKTVSPEYLILILSIHNAIHFFPSLHMFCDILELIKSENTIRWGHLLDIAREIESERIFLINLDVLNKLFGIELSKIIVDHIDADGMVDEMSENIIKRLFCPQPRRLIRDIVFQLRMFEKPLIKFKILSHLLFSPTQDVIKSLSLPRILEPIYYLLRFYEVIKKLL